MKYLITGGSGFLGQELINRLLKQNGTEMVRVLARSEANLVALKERFSKVEIIVGDVSDPVICQRAMRGIDGVFHLAAIKHVGIAENNVLETIKSNVPMALLEITRLYKPRFIIGVSTDKAASRKGVYGVTKFLMERLFDEYEQINPDTQYRIVRFGNIIYSTGSVLCKWKEKIQKGEAINITDRNATRFFWSVDQAVDLIFACLKNGTSAKPFTTKMKAIRIGDLLTEMLAKYGETQVNVTGLNVGENLHEIIVEEGIDSSHAEKFSPEEIRLMI